MGLRGLIRTAGSIVFWMATCVIAVFNLVVLRDVWLVLADLLLPTHRWERVADQFLIFIAAIAILAVTIYAFELYSKSKTTGHLWFNFCRVTAPQLWLWGTCHLFITLIIIIRVRMAICVGSVMLPVGGILAGFVFFRLRRIGINAGLSSSESKGKVLTSP